MLEPDALQHADYPRICTSSPFHITVNICKLQTPTVQIWFLESFRKKNSLDFFKSKTYYKNEIKKFNTSSHSHSCIFPISR